MNEQKLRRHLDEAHRQLLERDNAYRFHEDERRSRDREIEVLREELDKIQAWASELEGIVRAQERTIREMEATIAWRISNRLRLITEGALKAARRLPGE